MFRIGLLSGTYGHLRPQVPADVRGGDLAILKPLVRIAPLTADLKVLV